MRPEAVALVPNYMLPAGWMRYDVLPKNANGKFDRPRLKEGFVIAESRPARVQVQTPSPERPDGSDRMVSSALGWHERRTAYD